jgi:valyl-tRNA synthetase
VGSDYTCSEQKIASPGKFLTKLWNISRFIAGFPIPDDSAFFENLSASDKWILAELSKLTQECLQGYEEFNFFIPANKIRDFTWNTFAAHYLELAKGRAYGVGFNEMEVKSARHTLHECLRSILTLLAPICPFITEALWLKVYSKNSIHSELFPNPSKWNQEFLKFEKQIIEFNSLIWNDKKSRGLSLKEPLKIEIPESLKDFSKDLRIMHNLVTD